MTTDGLYKANTNIISNHYKIADNQQTSLPYEKQRLLEDNLNLFQTPDNREAIPDWAVMRLLSTYQTNRMTDKYEGQSAESHIKALLTESEKYNEEAGKILNLLAGDRKLQHQSGIYLPISGGKINKRQKKTRLGESESEEELPAPKRRKTVLTKSKKSMLDDETRQMVKVKGFNKFFVYGGGPLTENQQSASGKPPPRFNELSSSGSSSEEEEEEGSFSEGSSEASSEDSETESGEEYSSSSEEESEESD